MSDFHCIKPRQGISRYYPNKPTHFYDRVFTLAVVRSAQSGNLTLRPSSRSVTDTSPNVIYRTKTDSAEPFRVRILLKSYILVLDLVTKFWIAFSLPTL